MNFGKRSNLEEENPYANALPYIETTPLSQSKNPTG